VAQAENANIWAPLSEIEYIFQHALLRDAAYSMQLLARQRELHTLAVSAMEMVYRDDIEPHYGALAYHAEKAGVWEKALHYLTLAGKLSLGAYQNQQAIDYLTRALAFIPADDLRARFDLLLLRAEGYYNLSNHGEQVRDLSELEEIAAQLKDEGLLARTYMRRGYYSSSMSDFQEVIKYGFQAKSLAEAVYDDETILAAYILMPGAFLRLGKMSDAMQYAKDGIAFARRIKHRQGEGKILTLLGLVSLEMEGAAIASSHHEEALLIGREIKDRYLEAMALSNLATSMATSQGDYSIALQYYEQAYSLACELGNGKGQAITLSNMGWVNGILGNYPAAVNYLHQALTIMRRIGERPQGINTHLNLSAIAGGQGDAQNALDWAEKGLAIASELGDSTGSAWAYFYLGHACLLNEQFDASLRSFSKCVEIRLEISVPVLVAEARAGLLGVHLKMGNLLGAQAEMEWLLGYANTNPTFKGAEEPLRMFHALYRALLESRDPRVTIVLQNAVRLLDAQVSKLRSEDARRMYVDNVPWRRALYQAAKENGLAD